jgi:hypothetical protein
MILRGRLIIVTGASSGLGREIARKLACEEGADVILAARRRERLESLRDDIAASGPGTAWVCEVDLSSPDGPAALLQAAEEIASSRDREIASDRLGTPGLFGLVNNAGATFYGPVARMPAEDLNRIVALNVRSTLELTTAFVARLHGTATDAASAGAKPEPAAKGSRGKPAAAILTVTSLAAHLPVPYQAAYAASKSALHAFHESLAFELRHSSRNGGPRIVVTSVAPGGIATEWIERYGLNVSLSSKRSSEESSTREAKPTAGSSALLAPADRVAAQAIAAWKRERRASVAGFANKLTVLAGRLLPRELIGRLSERLYRQED